MRSFFYDAEREFMCPNCKSIKLARIKTDWNGQFLDIVKIRSSLKRPNDVPSIHNHILKRFTKPY